MFPIQKRSDHLALGQVRRAVLRRFGYLIYYTHDAEFVNILRIVHGARENL